jgi:hypothetical protein
MFFSNKDSSLPEKHTTPYSALLALLENRTPSEVASILKINPTHIYLGRRGNITPMLRESLKRHGIYKKRVRHRLHYECGYDEWGEQRRKDIERVMQEHGVESFTELVDHLLLLRR